MTDTDTELDALDAELSWLSTALAWAMVRADTDEKALAAAVRFLPRLREVNAKKCKLLGWDEGWQPEDLDAAVDFDLSVHEGEGQA